jgi:predicted TPR repeat methyltransferase
MDSYATLAQFYDGVQGDRVDHARYLESLIDKHHPRAKSLLELACGTGSVLEQLKPRYRITGIDISDEMLECAAQKLPEERLLYGDMRRFDLGETYDVVLCVFDSINHLLRFAEWEMVFERACAHVDDGGLFIFDINTERRLAALAAGPPSTQWFGEANLALFDVVDDNGVSVWRIRIFEHIESSNYRLHAEDIREVSFPPERIKESLRRQYRRVWIYDARRSRPTPRSDRLHFVCRR